MKYFLWCQKVSKKIKTYLGLGIIKIAHCLLCEQMDKGKEMGIEDRVGEVPAGDAGSPSMWHHLSFMLLIT